ncbi:MAG: CheR family methyltransferase [Pseudomonadota bacterium]
MNSVATADSTFNAIADLVRARTGLIFSPARYSDIETGIRKIMAKTGIADPGECLECLEADSLLLDELIAELTIGETYFFREPDHFAFIREVVIPEVRRLRGAEHTVRVWSAGCASGEEPYSLAILFEEEGFSERTRILATDISRVALARARKAAYGVWSLRGDGARLVGQYLSHSGGRFELAERFRQRVEFAYLNLAQNVYPTFATNTWGMDLVFCRNVLIYLDAKTTRYVARHLYESLADGGFLITGPSDPSLAEQAPYETLTTPSGVIYRKPTNPTRRLVIPPAAPAVSDLVVPPLATTPNKLSAAISAAPAEQCLSTLSSANILAEAREALARGDNARVIELTHPLGTDVAAIALKVRAFANLGDVETATEMASEAAATYPAAIEIGYLHAVLLMNFGRYGEADRVLRRVLYLDRSLAVARFTLGATLQRLGNFKGAVRAYRNAYDIAAQRSPEEIVPLSDGEKAGRLAAAAATRIEVLESLLETSR